MKKLLFIVLFFIATPLSHAQSLFQCLPTAINKNPGIALVGFDFNNVKFMEHKFQVQTQSLQTTLLKTCTTSIQHWTLIIDRNKDQEQMTFAFNKLTHKKSKNYPPKNKSYYKMIHYIVKTTHKMLIQNAYDILKNENHDHPFKCQKTNPKLKTNGIDILALGQDGLWKSLATSLNQGSKSNKLNDNLARCNKLSQQWTVSKQCPRENSEYKTYICAKNTVTGQQSPRKLRTLFSNEKNTITSENLFAAQQIKTKLESK